MTVLFKVLTIDPFLMLCCVLSVNSHDGVPHGKLLVNTIPTVCIVVGHTQWHYCPTDELVTFVHVECVPPSFTTTCEHVVVAFGNVRT